MGVAGGIGLLTKTVFELAEVQPLDKLVTVKEYEFTGSPVNEAVTPIPFCVLTVAGELPYAVMVQPPVLGRLEMATDPVEITHVGWVTMPAIGVFGIDGTALIFTEKLAGDVQPATVLTYSNEKAAPGVRPVMAAIPPTPDWVKPGGTEFTVQPVVGSPER